MSQHLGIAQAPGIGSNEKIVWEFPGLQLLFHERYGLFVHLTLLDSTFPCAGPFGAIPRFMFPQSLELFAVLGNLLEVPCPAERTLFWDPFVVEVVVGNIALALVALGNVVGPQRSAGSEIYQPLILQGLLQLCLLHLRS